MTEVKTTTVKLPTDTLIKIKAMAVEKGTTQNNIINDLINKGLKANGKKPKIKQMPFKDPNKKGNMKDNAGIIEVEDPENLDVNKVIDSIHTKKGLY